MANFFFGAAMPLLQRMVLLSLLVVSAVVQPAAARVLRIKIDHREVVAEGKSYGLPGPHERIYGTISFAVDPELPVNRIITDIDRAPRNVGGAVEFSADFYLLKPREISRGNGAPLYEASNRGVKAILTYFNLAPLTLNPASAEDLGDGFLMREGYINGRAGPAQELVSFMGSYLPFARTRESRSDRKDPRLSIQERYRSREEYLGLVSESALQLVEQGYLLDADLPRVLDRSRRQWDYLMKGAAPAGR
jgi:Alpha/beta hydrolase domain